MELDLKSNDSSFVTLPKTKCRCMIKLHKIGY